MTPVLLLLLRKLQNLNMHLNLELIMQRIVLKMEERALHCFQLN